MDRNSLTYKLFNRPYEYFIGEDFAEADEFTRTHFKSLAQAVGGVTLVGYGAGVYRATSSIEGDILSVPPIAIGAYIAMRGVNRAWENLKSRLET